MRGVSARSLDEVLSAAEDLAAEHHGLYDELFAIASMLDNAPALRRVLSDPTVEFVNRSQLIKKIGADRVSQNDNYVYNTCVRGRGGHESVQCVTIEYCCDHMISYDS